MARLKPQAKVVLVLVLAVGIVYGLRTAMQRGAPDSAIEYLRRALAEPPTSDRASVLIELGTAEYRLGGPGAVDHLHEGLAATRTPEERADAAMRLARALSSA